MTYVISDLHGYPLEKLIKLLDLASFGEDDFLYILGDVIDRNGDGGVDILCWLLNQANAQLILGNHESMLMACKFVFDEITDESIDNLSAEKMNLLDNYMFNGGDVTLKSLRKLIAQSPDTVLDIFDYLADAPLYEAVSAGGNDYILVHSGLGHFCKEKKLSQYTSHELLWTRPNFDTVYFDDITTVFGHTPTVYYGNEHRGKIIKTDTWINIDAGAAGGEEPILLCLDDLTEYRL